MGEFMAGKGNPKTGGRGKGTPNKSTALLNDAVIHAAEEAEDSGGMVGYTEGEAPCRRASRSASYRRAQCV
jgi:hypothetical protein